MHTHTHTHVHAIEESHPLGDAFLLPRLTVGVNFSTGVPALVSHTKNSTLRSTANGRQPGLLVLVVMSHHHSPRGILSSRTPLQGVKTTSPAPPYGWLLVRISTHTKCSQHHSSVSPAHFTRLLTNQNMDHVTESIRVPS